MRDVVLIIFLLTLALSCLNEDTSVLDVMDEWVVKSLDKVEI